MDSHPLATAVLAALGTLLPACAGAPAPGVRAGGDVFERELVCDVPGLGDIRNLEWLLASGTSAAADDADGRLWIGAQQGAVQVSREGEESDRLVFAQRLVNPHPIDVDADGTLETMDCGGGWSDVGLLDAAGKILWSYPRSKGLDSPDAMAAGPIGKDGETGFVVGMNAGGGVHLLDAAGRTLLSDGASNVFSVAVADLDSDGVAEILHSDGSGRTRWIQLRRADGAPLRRLAAEFSSFGLIRWPDAGSPPRVLGVDDGTVQIVDPCAGPEAVVLAEFELPDEGFSVDSGQLVRLDPLAEPYLAVERTIRATWSRAALYLFDAQRRLVYHEVFPVPYLAMAVLPADAPSEPDELLVGAGTEVWRYELRPASGAEPVEK